MAIDKVREYFRTFHIEDRIIEFDTSSATVELASKALHTDSDRIAKTLSFLVDEKPIVIVMTGDTRIDNHKFKSYFHTKAKLISPDKVESIIGHGIGGVCPFAVNNNVTVYLDVSLKKFDTVFPACGSSNSAIELTIEELEKYSHYKDWIDIGK